MQELLSKYLPYQINFNENHEYSFPNTPCGILPFYINSENEIVWGCVESNRVGPVAVAPPAGTQDIIAYNQSDTIRLEVAKPIPNTIESLKDFAGLSFNEKIYSDVIECLLKKNYQVYLESELATSIHETREEHGLDLRMDDNDKKGKNIPLLINVLEFDPQTVQAKRGTTTQKIFVAHLRNNDDVLLNYTDKIEQKIPQTKGRKFYEKGVWRTLHDIKENLKIQQDRYNDSDDALAKAELKAFESRVSLLDKIETSTLDYLKSYTTYINSSAQLDSLKYVIVQSDDQKKIKTMSQQVKLFNSPPNFKKEEPFELESKTVNRQKIFK